MSDLKAQDLYSEQASKRFAHYLFTKGDFEYAAEEYERLLFMNPGDDSIVARLSQSYRKLGQFQKAIKLFSSLYPVTLPSASLEQEYLTSALFEKDQQKFESVINKLSHLDQQTVTRTKVELALLTRHWEQAKVLLDTSPNQVWMQPYQRQVEMALAFQPKKPWLAATYSAILPGSGKVYTKNVKEGITSFLFVAAIAYQSYRGFHKRGTKSITGWVYGGLSLGFYLGNIYGAQQSAKNYNNRQYNLITNEVDKAIYSRY